MDPVIRKRYEAVKSEDLVGYFAALHLIPTCSQCEGTKFHIPTIRALTIGPAGPLGPDDALQTEPVEKSSVEPFEMRGQYSGPAFYPLTCEFCGTILSVDAYRVLLWTEHQRQRGDEVIGRHE